MPVRRVRYEPNHSGMRRHMLGDDTRSAAVAAARDIVPLAQAFSPESDPAEKGAGDGTSYEDHFFVDETLVVTIQDGPYSNPRAAAAVGNDAAYAAQVEFGEGTRPGDARRPQGGAHGTPARPLGRAGAFFGGYRGGAPQ
jgi:hypothetical protein